MWYQNSFCMVSSKSPKTTLFDKNYGNIENVANHGKRGKLKIMKSYCMCFYSFWQWIYQVSPRKFTNVIIVIVTLKALIASFIYCPLICQCISILTKMLWSQKVSNIVHMSANVTTIPTETRVFSRGTQNSNTLSPGPRRGKTRLIIISLHALAEML